MQTVNKADENYRKLAELFPNVVTETIDEYGEVVRAIDKDVLMQEIAVKVVEGREERYQFTWPDKKKAMLAANAPITATLRPVVADSVGKDGTPGGFDSENLFNLLMFLPFGFHCPGKRTGSGWLRTAAAGLGLSCAIELLQPFFGRSFDCNDILLNALGALIGAALSGLLARWHAAQTRSVSL